MSHFNDVMRIGRKYRTEVNKLKSKYNQTIAKEADKEGSKYYDSFLENQNADYSAKKKELVLQAKKNVSEQIKTMRENRNNHKLNRLCDKILEIDKTQEGFIHQIRDKAKINKITQEQCDKLINLLNELISTYEVNYE